MAKVQNRSTKGDEVLEALPLACAHERAAAEFMEAQRWGGKPACPRCGSENVVALMDSKTGLRRADHRWFCRDCKVAKQNPQFTVRTGTVFEDSRIELRHWCYAFWRASTSKKGVSALEIHRQTGLSYKSSLFLLNRIRYAMADSVPGKLGEGGGIVEADETFIGGKYRRYGMARSVATEKQIVAAALERNGQVKTKVIPSVTSHNIRPFLQEHVSFSARLMTDESKAYVKVGREFAGGHESVKHMFREYARGDVTTNTIEGFFSIVKRSLNGIYHAVSKEHLHRYLAEIEFRYNHRELDDGQRTVEAIRGAEGKRLMYKATVC